MSIKRVISSALFCVGAFVLSVTTALGGSFYLEDAAATGLGQVSTALSNPSPGASAVLSDSKATPACTDSNNCATANYSASAQFGKVSLSFNAYASCTYSNGLLCGPSVGGYHYAEAGSGATDNNADDSIQVGTIAGGSGLLEITYIASGTIWASGGFSGGNISFNLDNNTVAFEVELNDCPVLCNNPTTTPYVNSNSILLANGSTIAFTNFKLNGAAWDYVVSGIMVLPVHSNSTNNDLLVRVDGTTDIAGGPQYTVTNSFNATGTLAVGGAQIYDSTGTTLLNGVSIQSGSGYDYTQPLGTPEPNTWVLLITGVIVLSKASRV